MEKLVFASFDDAIEINASSNSFIIKGQNVSGFICNVGHGLITIRAVSKSGTKFDWKLNPGNHCPIRASKLLEVIEAEKLPTKVLLLL